jgi:hypothetical protein
VRRGEEDDNKIKKRNPAMMHHGNDMLQIGVWLTPSQFSVRKVQEVRKNKTKLGNKPDKRSLSHQWWGPGCALPLTPVDSRSSTGLSLLLARMDLLLV